jgi:hypothetical protein
MTDTPKISLAQQAEAVEFAKVRQDSLNFGGSVKEMRTRSTGEYDAQRLAAAAKTLRLFSKHQDEMRWFLSLSPETRQALKERAIKDQAP